MTEPRLDVLGIGNAIVDVIADADDAFLAAQGLDKGSMRLIDEAEAAASTARWARAREVSGGSAANTAAGLAALGCKAGFIGQVADDQLGEIYRHDIAASASTSSSPRASDVGATARCLILVTPDAQRTMNTFLGAAQMLERDAVDRGRGRRRRDPLSRRLFVGSRRSRARRWKAIDAARARRHARSPSLCPTASRRAPPRRLQCADRRRRDRHPVRQ